MLDYLKTIEGLTVIRDEIRLRLEDETRDRQSVAEFAEASLTQILGELVTPDPTCRDCGKPADGFISESGEGVCEAHIWGALLTGVAVHVRGDAPLATTLIEREKAAKLAQNTAYANARPPAYCSSCNADLWFNPEKAEYVALFDAPCPVTTNHKHSARR